jgi:CO/xanthine dehydrogenase Mo-binding subunit
MTVETPVKGGIDESVRRPDGIPKVKGAFAYSSDLWADGMLGGATLRSPHPRARIRELNIAPALAIPGMHAILTHEDVPGRKVYIVGV